jgi:hypothetical protein
MGDTIIISGAAITDTCFEVSLPGLEIAWNVTRIEHDAFRGRFGPPENLPFIALAGWTDPNRDKYQNVDKEKVWRFARSEAVVSRPYWKSGGLLMTNYPILNIPTIAVMLKTGDETAMVIPIDGNHRMVAREIAGFDTFPRFVVPPELEGEYRIRVTVT